MCEIIKIDNVSKAFDTKNGKFYALKGVSLSVAEGEALGVIGESGAGKSTLSRCINGLEKPDEGAVYYRGEEVGKLKGAALRSHRRKAATIFQSFNLLEQKTALQNVAFAFTIAGVKKSEAIKKSRELLSLVGIEDKADEYPSQLSGGQKQRVAIARALATSPETLICDEATSALDPASTQAILDLLNKLKTELSLTLVVITHEMSVVKKLCDKVAVLSGGELVEYGTVSDIFNHPVATATKKLVAYAKAEEEL